LSGEKKKVSEVEGGRSIDFFRHHQSTLTSIKLSWRISSTTFSTRWLLGDAIPSSSSFCAAASAAKLRGLPKSWEEEEEEERKIVVCHSAAEDEERVAAVKIDAELLKDEEDELVDAPAPAAAREQAEPSVASRERVASWAAARRSIVFFLGC
jgi:hypothetical protein